MAGAGEAYQALPHYFSTLFGCGFSVWGDFSAWDQTFLKGELGSSGSSIFYLRKGRLCGILQFEPVAKEEAPVIDSLVRRRLSLHEIEALVRAQAKSLREISGGLASALGKLRHLGVSSTPNKSTLAYANAHRPWELFESLFYQVLQHCQTDSPGKPKRFRFKNKLLSMDSTTIALCLSLFPWAHYRTTKGAIKLHMLLDHDGYLPSFACISDGKRTISR